MTPWLLLSFLVAGANWSAFLLVRGRWGRSWPLLAVAALLGTMGGELIAARIGLGIVSIGQFHLVGASLGAQLAMLLTVLLGSLLPSRDQPDPEA